MELRRKKAAELLERIRKRPIVFDELQNEDSGFIVFRGLVDSEISNKLLKQFEQDIHYNKERPPVNGTITMAHDAAWFCNYTVEYRYGQVVHRPVAMPKEIETLAPTLQKTITEAILQYNPHLSGYIPPVIAHGVLCSRYINEKDSISYHRDREPILGNNPFILNPSLGEERTLQLRRDADQKVWAINLSDGDAVLFYGRWIQDNFQHRVRKETVHKGTRVVLSFRHFHDELAAEFGI